MLTAFVIVWIIAIIFGAAIAIGVLGNIGPIEVSKGKYIKRNFAATLLFVMGLLFPITLVYFILLGIFKFCCAVRDWTKNGIYEDKVS